VIDGYGTFNVGIRQPEKAAIRDHQLQALSVFLQGGMEAVEDFEEPHRLPSQEFRAHPIVPACLPGQEVCDPGVIAVELLRHRRAAPIRPV